MVEGTLPLGKRLKAIHHTTVETVGRGSNEQEGNPCIEDDEPEVTEGENVGGIGRRTDEIPLVVEPGPVWIKQMGITG